MDEIAPYHLKSPLGHLEIRVTDDAIVCINFQKGQSLPERPECFPSHPLVIECSSQLSAYFDGRLRKFDLPLQPLGTKFQIKIWGLLEQIPFGKTISYAELAKQTGDIKTIRAAGTANGKNPIPIIIPCHRVIGSNGTLVGYSGEMWRKKWLLDLENKWANGVQSLF